MAVIMSAAEFRQILTSTPESRDALEKVGMVIIEEIQRLQELGLSNDEISAQMGSGMTQGVLGARK